MHQTTSVFVYGTLKPGEVNDWVYRDWAVQVQPALTYGQLYHLPLGYPAMCPGTTPIQGYHLSFDRSSILERLDEFEQHDRATLAHRFPTIVADQVQYQRQQVELHTPDQTPLGWAWAYTMRLDQIQQLHGVLLPHGYWSSRDS